MPMPPRGLIVQPSPRHRGPGQVKSGCAGLGASHVIVAALDGFACFCCPALPLCFALCALLSALRTAAPCLAAHPPPSRRLGSPGATRRYGVRAWMRAALTGAPLGAVKGRRIRPQRGHGHGCPCLFARAGSPVEKPLRPFTRFAGHECPAKCSLWGALLFGYFLLGTQEKVTRSL
jgi:hypothetical protein